MAAEEVERDLSPAVVEDRNLALLPEYNHHGVEMLLNLVPEAESMRLQLPHRVNNLPSAVDNSHRAIARHRSAVRILAGSRESQLLRQSRFVPKRVRGSARIQT